MSGRTRGLGFYFAFIALIVVVSPGSFTPAAARQNLSSDEPGVIVPISPNNPTELGIWEDWNPADVKGLDPWGDSSSKTIDIIAIYEKENTESLAFRLDFLDLSTEVITPTLFALDFRSGGNSLILPGIITPTFDITWDLMVVVSGTQFSLYDSTFIAHPDQLGDPQIDRQLDFISFSIDRDAFTGWDGSAFQMQALVTDVGFSSVLDKTISTPTNATTGRAKLILSSLGGMIGFNPDAVSWYDGYRLRPNERPGERRGFRYTLDAVEKYQLPLTYITFGLDVLPGNEFLRINDRLISLASQGLLDPMTHSFYGQLMSWQPVDVDQKMIEMSVELNESIGLPISDVFYPYEGKITPNDIQVIQDAGFQAIYGNSEYRYWFGWIDDWSDPVAVKADIESLRKVHLINGMKFVFHTANGNYQGFFPDERWGEINWDQFNEYETYVGTDQGLYLWWRRILQDMAINPDQEQFFTIGTDYTLTSWMFPDVVDWNFKWLASHPWIEVTTYSSILDRNWQVIDHGTLALGPDELLQQYPLDGNLDYNAYFPQFYYGGISDGHSPLIPAGEEIEAYYDYVPYLRDGQPIPSGRIMGDDATPGSIVYETLHNLRAAPDNDLTRLAWIAYFMSIGEQTMHTIHFYAGNDLYPGGDWGGRYLSPDAKFVANKMRQVNKISAAAVWAENVAQGTVSEDSQAVALDLDLDGEDEYVLSNNQVFAIFENDGARLEFAFAYSPQIGPLQMVAPIYQVTIKKGTPDGNYENGEVGELLTQTWMPDAAFVDDLDADDELDFTVYNANLAGVTLTFSSPGGAVQKSFTLDGDTIHAHYAVPGMAGVRSSFGLVTNMLLMYTQDWSESWQAVQFNNSAGWQTIAGGLALITPDVGTGGPADNNSCVQSPARDEQRERDDYNSYPGGHFFPYPYSGITYFRNTSGDGMFDVSLKLSADPLSFVFLPLVRK